MGRVTFSEIERKLKKPKFVRRGWRTYDECLYILYVGIIAIDGK